jgi:AmmeMemoRadiSam system protein A
MSEKPPEILDSAQQVEALGLARNAVESWVASSLRIAAPADSSLNHVRVAAFVTLTLSGRLRGCVGSLEPIAPFAETVVHCAIAAACRDSRFPCVTRAELMQLRYEISALTPPRALEDIGALVIGLDGLLVELSGRRGLLLPQVATQYGWDRETFLDQVCLKAGGAAGDWRRGARIWTFQAHVFSEGDPAA